MGNNVVLGCNQTHLKMMIKMPEEIDLESLNFKNYKKQIVPSETSLFYFAKLPLETLEETLDKDTEELKMIKEDLQILKEKGLIEGGRVRVVSNSLKLTPFLRELLDEEEFTLISENEALGISTKSFLKNNLRLFLDLKPGLITQLADTKIETNPAYSTNKDIQYPILLVNIGNTTDFLIIPDEKSGLKKYCQSSMNEKTYFMLQKMISRPEQITNLDLLHMAIEKVKPQLM